MSAAQLYFPRTNFKARVECMCNKCFCNIVAIRDNGGNMGAYELDGKTPHKCVRKKACKPKSEALEAAGQLAML